MEEGTLCVCEGRDESARHRLERGGDGFVRGATRRSGGGAPRALKNAPSPWALLTHPRATHTHASTRQRLHLQTTVQPHTSPARTRKTGGEQLESSLERRKEREEETRRSSRATRSSCGHDDARLRHGACLVGATAVPLGPVAAPKTARAKQTEGEASPSRFLRPCRSLSPRQARARRLSNDTFSS